MHISIKVAPIKAAEKPSGARVAAKKLAGAETNFAAAQKQLFDTQQKLHGDQSATKKVKYAFSIDFFY